MFIKRPFIHDDHSFFDMHFRSKTSVAVVHNEHAADAASKIEMRCSVKLERCSVELERSLETDAQNIPCSGR
jgi:hypothetical protein